MLGSRIFRIIQAWWFSRRSQLQAQVSVSDQQYQQQLKQKQATLAQAAAQQQLGLLEAEKRRCQQQLQQLTVELQTFETAAVQALQLQDEALALQHLLQLAATEQQQQLAERRLALLLQQLAEQSSNTPDITPNETEPLAELQQLALQASAERHLQRLKTQGTSR